MDMFPLFLLMVFIMARANSTFHPHLLFKRYVIIKNKTVSRLLIGQSDPVNGRTKNAKANRNKLTYSGIIFHSLFLLLVCFSVIMALLPDFPCEGFVYESKSLLLTGNTLNEKLPVILAFVLLFAETAFHFVNTSKYAVEKTTAKRFTRFLYYFFAIMFSAGMIGSFWMFVVAILR